MLRLLWWLFKLPFVLLGIVLSIVFGIIGLVLTIIGAVIAPIVGVVWTTIAFGLAFVLVLWLLIKLLGQKKTVIVR